MGGGHLGWSVLCNFWHTGSGTGRAGNPSGPALWREDAAKNAGVSQVSLLFVCVMEAAEAGQRVSLHCRDRPVPHDVAAKLNARASLSLSDSEQIVRGRPKPTCSCSSLSRGSSLAPCSTTACTAAPQGGSWSVQRKQTESMKEQPQPLHMRQASLAAISLCKTCTHPAPTPLNALFREAHPPGSRQRAMQTMWPLYCAAPLHCKTVQHCSKPQRQMHQQMAPTRLEAAGDVGPGDLGNIHIQL